jgi:glycosyltransferase A (GT-A) superfamily protein (DUF2064 family)
VRVLLLGGGDGTAAPGLVRTLGAERAARVRRLLRARACAWAGEAFGPEGVRLVADSSFAEAVADVGAADAEGVVAIRPEVPTWQPELAAALRGDLAAGCALSLGPVFDGGLYLLAVAEPSAALAALAALDLAGPGAMTDLIALARREAWDVGLLRAERGLRRARDVRALLADPLTDPELRALLR